MKQISIIRSVFLDRKNGFLAQRVQLSGQTFWECDGVSPFVCKGEKEKRKGWKAFSQSPNGFTIWGLAVPKGLLRILFTGSQGSKFSYLGEKLVPRNGSSKEEYLSWGAAC